MVNSVLSVAVVLGSVTAAASLTVLAWRQRPQPGATAFAVLMAGSTWWVATSSLGLFTVDPARRLLLTELEWLGIVVIPPAWLVFALAYTSREQYITRYSLGMLASVPVITVALALTTGTHGLVYTDPTVSVYGRISLVQYGYGTWAWVFFLYAYTLLALGTLLVVQLGVETSSRYRLQAFSLLLSMLAPWCGNVIYLLGWVPVERFDPTPFLFIISGSVGIAGLTQFNLLDSQPVSSRIARETVVENMDDGVVVVDTDDRIIDMNRQAAGILDVNLSTVIDTPATAVVPSYDSLGVADESGVTETVELEHGGSTRYYEIRRTDLRTDRESGSIIGIHDVTDRRNRVQQLDVLNRVLRHNLRNEMNAVYGFAAQVDDDVADRIQNKAMSMVELGNKAREIDQLLNEDDGDPVEISNIVDIQLRRARDEYPDVTFEHSLPETDRLVPRTTGPVLENVVENAAEHNDSDDPWVSIDVQLADDRTIIEVRDNGPGLPDEEQAVLRTGEETQLQHSSGLGLWLVSWGTQLMGGSVSVTEREQDAGGTVVRLDIPTVDTRSELVAT